MNIPPPEPEEPTHCYRVRSVTHPKLGTLEVSGILCGRLGPPCVQCGDVSEVLCDFPIGDQERTCDKPLCLTCAPEVGVDKNYCRDHADGHGMLLFRRPARPDEVVDMLGEIRRPRAKRIPKAPPPYARWRVLKPDYTMGPLQLGTPTCGWTTEEAARRLAAERGGIVEHWDQFVACLSGCHPSLLPVVPG